MSIFRNTRRIVDHTIQKRLYAPSPTILANKGKKLFTTEELKNNQLIIEEVGYKRYSVVKKDIISPQHMAQPRVSSIIAHNHITPRIYYEVANKDKRGLKNRAVQKDTIKYKGENIDRRYPQNRNECGPKNNVTSRLPVEDVRKPIVYDMILHNHVMAPNKGILSKELKTNRNQVIYHRIFNVPDVQRQNSFKSLKNVTWFAKTGDEKKGAPKPGRLGKLSSLNESEYFFKTDRERLMELNKKLKDKEKGPDAPKKG